MKKRKRLSFDRLVILLALVVAIGLVVTPALADDDGQGVLVEDQEEGIPVEIDDGGEDAVYEESFGQNNQATWIPSADFTPYDSTTTWQYLSPGMRRITGGSPWMDAGVRLPSGARLILARIFYDDRDAAQRVQFWIFKNRNDVSPFTFTTPVNALQSPAGVARYTSSFVNVNETIQNAQHWYHARFRTNGNTYFSGVRLFWNRQIRTGLANPFVDIGHLPAVFQNSIKALAASGITTGTSPGIYSPSANVNRGQMAVFLARALGLYWDFFSGY